VVVGVAWDEAERAFDPRERRGPHGRWATGGAHPDAAGHRWYHGSDDALAPGDLLRPGRATSGKLYASTHPETASGYGRHLYEVEPLGPNLGKAEGTGAQVIDPSGGPPGYESDQPMRVVREVRSAQRATWDPGKHPRGALGRWARKADALEHLAEQVGKEHFGAHAAPAGRALRRAAEALRRGEKDAAEFALAEAEGHARAMPGGRARRHYHEIAKHHAEVRKAANGRSRHGKGEDLIGEAYVTPGQAQALSPLGIVPHKYGQPGRPVKPGHGGWVTHTYHARPGEGALPGPGSVFGKHISPAEALGAAQVLAAMRAIQAALLRAEETALTRFDPRELRDPHGKWRKGGGSLLGTPLDDAQLFQQAEAAKRPLAAHLRVAGGDAKEWASVRELAGPKVLAAFPPKTGETPGEYKTRLLAVPPYEWASKLGWKTPGAVRRPPHLRGPAGHISTVGASTLEQVAHQPESERWFGLKPGVVKKGDRVKVSPAYLRQLGIAPGDVAAVHTVAQVGNAGNPNGPQREVFLPHVGWVGNDYLQLAPQSAPGVSALAGAGPGRPGPQHERFAQAAADRLGNDMGQAASGRPNGDEILALYPPGRMTPAEYARKLAGLNVSDLKAAREHARIMGEARQYQAQAKAGVSAPSARPWASPTQATQTALPGTKASPEPAGPKAATVALDAAIKSDREQAVKPGEEFADDADLTGDGLYNYFGNTADTTIVTYANGSQWVRKRGLTENEQQTERLVSLVSGALDAGSPPVVLRPDTRPGAVDTTDYPVSTEEFQPKVPHAVTAVEWLGGVDEDETPLSGDPEEMYNTPQGNRIALMDTVTGMRDRHFGNWLVQTLPNGDQVPVPIDNGGADFIGGSSSEFADHLDVQGFSDAQWAKYRAALDGLQPQFSQAGRASDWSSMMSEFRRLSARRDAGGAA